MSIGIATAHSIAAIKASFGQFAFEGVRQWSRGGADGADSHLCKWTSYDAFDSRTTPPTSDVSTFPSSSWNEKVKWPLSFFSSFMVIPSVDMPPEPVISHLISSVSFPSPGSTSTLVDSNPQKVCPCELLPISPTSALNIEKPMLKSI